MACWGCWLWSTRWWFCRTSPWANSWDCSPGFGAGDFLIDKGLWCFWTSSPMLTLHKSALALLDFTFLWQLRKCDSCLWTCGTCLWVYDHSTASMPKELRVHKTISKWEALVCGLRLKTPWVWMQFIYTIALISMWRCEVACAWSSLCGWAEANSKWSAPLEVKNIKKVENQW